MIKCPFCPNTNIKLYTLSNSNEGPAICTNSNCKNTILYYINDSISDARIFTLSPDNIIDSFKPFIWLYYIDNQSFFYKNFDVISSFNYILPVSPSNISSFIHRLNNLTAFS